MDGHRQKTVACVVCNKNFSSEERVNEHNKKVHQKWKKDKKASFIIHFICKLQELQGPMHPFFLSFGSQFLFWQRKVFPSII